MKQIIFLLQLLLLAGTACAADSIIITQVLYDPLTSDSGGEAVELYNPTSGDIDISDWVISTETSLTDAVFPENTIIRSGGYYLAADAGWSISKDEVSWPQADLEEAMTLSNTDAGVALSNGSHVIDAVGWGNSLNIATGLFEGTPHTGASEGQALARINNGSNYADTGNNMADFTAETPVFHNSSSGNSYSGGEIIVVAIVEGAFPVINSLEIITDDDSSIAGNQINPVPKKNKTVEVEAVVSHDNGNGYLQQVTISFGSTSINMTKQQELNTTSAVYKAEFNMSYYDSAGNYTLTATAADNSGFSVNDSAYFDYAELIAMEIDASTLQFAAMPGMASEIIGDYNEATATNTTINNIGNSIFDIELSGKNLSSGSSVIDVSNIQYTFNGDYNNSLAGTLSHEKQTKHLAIEAAAKQPLSFKLSVPTATAPGNYTGTITLIAVKP